MYWILKEPKIVSPVKWFYAKLQCNYMLIEKKNVRKNFFKNYCQLCIYFYVHKKNEEKMYE